MNSLNDEDFTLPINFDESANPDQLPEVSQGTLLEFPDGSIPLVQKVATGRLSPIRARTMKEYDQQLADLKKENFNLKLRIYFLEERMEQRIGQDDEDLFKTNIELKVEVEGLKKELMDKQELLKKASRALESISSQHHTELVKARENSQETSNISLHKAEEKIRELEGLLENKQQELRYKEDEVRSFEQRIQDFMFPVSGSSDGDRGKIKWGDSEGEDEHATKEENLESAKRQILEFEELIGQLRGSLKTKDLIIEQLEEEKKDLSKEANGPLKNKGHSLQRQDQGIQTLPTPEDCTDFGPDGGDLQSHLSEYKKKVGHLEKKLMEAQEGIAEKDELIAKLEHTVSNVDKGKKELLDEIENLRSQFEDSSQNVRQREKIIKELADRAVKMQQQDEDSQDQLKEKDEEINQLRDQIHKLKMNRYQGSEDRLSLVSEHQDRVLDMEDQLRKMQVENERLHKTIGRQEAEISRKMEELKRADSVLRQREENLQGLRDTLSEEKHRNSEKNDTVTKHYQALLDDTQRQIASQEKMLQRMSQSLRDKDNELHLAMSQPSSDNKEKIVAALKDQLKEKDLAIENAVEENFKMQELKDNEIRQLKVNLRERERDIDRANHMLLTAEETIDSLEAEGKEKDAERRKLLSTIKSQQKVMQDETEKSENALEEKEAMIQRLRAALAKDSALQNSESDNLLGQLEQRLKDKEDLLDEVMAVHAKSKDAADKTNKDLLRQLRERDAEMQDAQEKSNAEVAELNRKLHSLQSNLNKKEYDLQTVEASLEKSQEQQKEWMEKMQAAMNERDITIMALVESARQRDKLLRELPQGAPPGNDSVASKLEIQALKDDISYLNNELNKKDELIGRLKRGLEMSAEPLAGPSRLGSHIDELEREFAGRTENEVNRKLREFGIKDVHELQRIQEELQTLRLEKSGGENDAGSRKLQKALHGQIKEAKTLNRSLEAERNIYLNLRQVDGDGAGSSWTEKDAFASEIAAVQTLRQQLKDSIKRNSQLGKQLEKQLKKTVHKQESGSNSDGKESSKVEKQLLEEIERLRKQLEDSQLAVPIAGGPEIENGATPVTTTEADGNETKKSDLENADNTSHQRSASYWDSFLPSFQDLPNVKDLVPKEEELQQMTPEQLRTVVHKLSSALEVSHHQSDRLQDHIASRDLSPTREDNNSSPGAASAQMVDGGATLRQMEQLQHELTRSERDKAKLRRQLDSLLESPESNKDSGIIPVLREQLAEAKEALKNSKEAFRQQKLESSMANQSMVDSQYKIEDLSNQLQNLQAQLTHSENINSILKRQLELNAECSPDQLNSESAEPLTDDGNNHLGSAAASSGATLSGDSKQRSLIPLPLSRQNSITGNENAASTVPDSQSFLQRQIDSIRNELHEERLHRKLLQGKLASTEQTVRSQREKSRHHRKLLEDSGLINRARHKSSSESNLTSVGLTSASSFLDTDVLLTASASADDLLSHREHSPHVEAISLNFTPPVFSTDPEFSETDDPVVLKDQVNRLKSQLQKSNRIIKGLRSKQKQNKGGSTGTPQRPPRPPGDRLSLDSANLEVTLLRQQLDAVRKESEELQRKLQNENDHDNSFENLQEIENLRAKLQESEGNVANLERHLEEVLQTVEEMLHVNDEGKVEEIEVTPEKVVDLRDKLNATLKLSNWLVSNLQGQSGGLGNVSESHLEAGDSRLNGSPDEEEIIAHKKKVLALQHEKTDLICQLSAHQEKLLQAEATNNLLSQRYTSLERELQEIQRSHKRHANEVERSRNNQSQDSGSFLDLSDKGQRSESDLDASSKLKGDTSQGQLEGQISQVQMENAILAKEIVKTRVERDNYHQQNNLLSSQLEERQAQLQQLAGQLEAVSSQLRDAENECHKVEKDRLADQEKLKSVEKEKRKIERSLKEQKDSNNALTVRLEEEQSAAKAMHNEVKRLNEEIDRSQAAIAKLQRKLKHNQLTNGSAMNHRTSSSSSVDGLPPRPIREDSTNSIERRRNPSVESVGTSGSGQLMSSPEMPVQPSPSSSRPSVGPLSDLQRSQGVSGQHWDTFTVDPVIDRDSVDWGPVRYSNPFHATLPPADDTVSKPYSPNQMYLEGNLRGGANSNRHEHGEQDLLSQIENLRFQLKAANEKSDDKRWSQHLDFGTPPTTRISINSRTSFQASRPSHTSSHASRPSYNDGETQIGSSADALSVPTQTSPMKSGAPGVEIDLAAHLQDIKMLRIKLEQSEELNNRLRDQLEKHLNSGSKGNPSVHVTDQLTSLQNEVKGLREKVKEHDRKEHEVDILAKEVEILRQELSEKLMKIDDQDFEIAQLRQQRAALNNVIEERDKILNDLHQSNQEKRRLMEEIRHMQDQLSENTELNETLQLELSVYDQMMAKPEGSRTAPDLPSVGGMDLSLLLEEIRKLRSQLLKTISANNALRKQLEERLLSEETSAQNIFRNETIRIDHRTGQYLLGETLIDREMDRDKYSQKDDGSVLNGSFMSNGSQDYMRYSVYDMEKPPRPALKKIGTDLRLLYAVGKIDDYELLKKEIQESVALVTSVENELKEHLAVSRRMQSQSSDYKTLRSAHGVIENLRYCIKEQERLIKLFWTSQMPQTEGTEKVIDPALEVEYDKLHTQHRSLQEEHQRLHKKYKALKLEMKVVFKRLQGQRMIKEQFEKDVVDNLSDIHKLVYGARGNLEETKENMT